MGLFQDWGFNTKSWQGQRGEYWVLGQMLLILAFVLLPLYRPASWGFLLNPPVVYAMWAVALSFGLLALGLFGKGLADLGQNLTPLPHPRDQSELVQSGVYGIVRHPLYSGVIFSAIAWALYLVSLSHLLGVGVLFVFFDAKARKEEAWLTEKYPTYAEYQQRVSKLIPWIY